MTNLKKFTEFGLNIDWSPYSNFEEKRYCLKKLILFKAINTKKQITKRQRKQKEVLEDYDLSAWKQVLDSHKWEDVKNLEEFLHTKTSNEIDRKKSQKICLINSKIGEMSEYDYYKFREKILCNNIKKLINNEEIIELGCGYGYNLFSMRNDGIKNSMCGYDLSKNAIEAGKKINIKFNCNIRFEIKDLTEKFVDLDLKDKTIITHYAMEQLKYNTKFIIKNLIQSKPKQVIHFEAAYEMYGESIRDKTSKEYIKSQDYQDNLVYTIKKLEKQKMLKIEEITRLGYARNPLHEATLIVWRPVQDSDSSIESANS